MFIDRGGIKGNEQVIESIGISTIYWNHNAFCGHSLDKPHGTIFRLGSNISHSFFVGWVESTRGELGFSAGGPTYLSAIF